MSNDPAEQSSVQKVVEKQLAGLVGEWEGQTRTWFEPGQLAAEAPNRGTIRALRGGQFVIYEYESEIEGQPTHGLAIYGYNHFTKEWESAWVDSFHMNTNMMISTGPLAEQKLSVLGSYAVAGGGPPWGWRTEIELLDPDHLLITAYNLSPQGEEAKALETDHIRRK